MAGCIDATPPAPPVEGGGPETPPGEEAANETEPQLPLAANPFWASNRTGDVAILARFSVDEPGKCVVAYGIRTLTAGARPTVALFVNTPQTGGVMAMSASGMVHAHAFNIVDTRTDSGSPGIRSEILFTFDQADDYLEILFAVTDLGRLAVAPWEYIEGHEDATVYLGLSCQGDEHEQSIQAGTEVLLLDQHSMRGGVGVHAGYVGTASYQDAFHREFAAPSVVLRGLAAGQFGSLTLTLPDKEELWEFGPLGMSSLNLASAPGEFGYELTTVGRGIDLFLLCSVGLHPVDSLSTVNEELESL